MFHIHTPQPTTGTTKFLDVEFHDGVAHVEELHQVRELALVQHGYTVVHEIVGETLEEQTVTQLRQLAKDEGIEIPAKARKPEIIKALTEAPVKVLTPDSLDPNHEGPNIIPIPGSVDNGDGSFTATAGFTENGGVVKPGTFAVFAEGGESYVPASPSKRSEAILSETKSILGGGEGSPTEDTPGTED